MSNRPALSVARDETRREWRSPTRASSECRSKVPPVNVWRTFRAARVPACMTPFHNMALMSPATTEADIDHHTRAFDAALAALFA